MPRHENKAATEALEAAKKFHARFPALRFASTSSFGKPEDKAETLRIEALKAKYRQRDKGSALG